MSSKTATYFYRRHNWTEINNMFAYDVKFPDRLSKKQQILRLFKNSMRRLYDLEIHGEKNCDFVTYSEGCHEIKKDFLKLKNAKSETEINNLLDKYEDFIEKTYRVTPFIRDNVAYEWRHQKALVSFTEGQLQSDPFGYYKPNSLDYYPNPREFEFRDEFPYDDQATPNEYTDNGWENISENVNNDIEKTGQAKSPEDLKNYVNELRKKIENKNI